MANVRTERGEFTSRSHFELTMHSHTEISCRTVFIKASITSKYFETELLRFIYIPKGGSHIIENQCLKRPCPLLFTNYLNSCKATHTI